MLPPSVSYSSQRYTACTTLSYNVLAVVPCFAGVQPNSCGLCEAPTYEAHVLKIYIHVFLYGKNNGTATLDPNAALIFSSPVCDVSVSIVVVCVPQYGRVSVAVDNDDDVAVESKFFSDNPHHFGRNSPADPHNLRVYAAADVSVLIRSEDVSQ